MSRPFDLIRIMDGLKRQYGGELKYSLKHGSPFYSIAIPDRLDFFKILVQKIKDADKGEEYFTNTRRDEIVGEMMSTEGYEGHANKVKRNLCRLAILKDLRMAIAEIYAEEDEVPKALREKPFQKEFEPKKDNESDIKEVVDPDMAKLLGFDDE